jgi:hypothetical protein
MRGRGRALVGCCTLSNAEDGAVWSSIGLAEVMPPHADGVPGARDR